MKRVKESATESPTDQSGRVSITEKEKDEKAELQSTWPLFVIILPAYKEEVSTLEETLRVLASHPQARRSYHVRSSSIFGHLLPIWLHRQHVR